MVITPFFIPFFSILSWFFQILAVLGGRIALLLLYSHRWINSLQLGHAIAVLWLFSPPLMYFIPEYGIWTVQSRNLPNP